MYLDSFIAAVLANPGSCDEVWLATDYGFPSQDIHAQSARMLRLSAEKLRQAGLKVSLQISNTVGHGQYMSSRDCSGLVYPGSPVEKMVGHDGTVSDYCFCWRGKNFLEYTLEYIGAYVREIQPDTVWIDDDLRADNHFPVNYGCFCDDCISLFNRQYGCDFSREKLVEQISFGNIVWREKYMEFTKQGLSLFTERICKVVHENSPNTRMGYQFAPYNLYTGFDYSYIMEPMYRVTGIKPVVRPGGGMYNDHTPWWFVIKAENMSWQSMQLPEYVDEICPEIENLPDVVYGKSIGGTCFETSYYFASGAHSMSYAMLMADYEPMQWHSQMLSAFASHRPFWEKLSEANKGTMEAGWIAAFPDKAYLRKCSAPFEYVLQNMNFANELRFLGISIAVRKVSRDDESVRLLSAENASAMSSNEINELLTLPVITDAAALDVLIARGFSLPVSVKNIDISRFGERFLKHPVNGSKAGRTWGGPLALDRGYCVLIEDYNLSEPLGEYIRPVPSTDGIRKSEACFIEDKQALSSCIFTTEYGAKWAVFAFDMWHRTLSSEKRNQYLDASEYISGKRQVAELATPFQATCQARCYPDGSLSHVSITNCTVANSGPVEIRVLRSSVKENNKAVLMIGQYVKPCELKLEKVEAEKDLLKVTIPDVHPWSVVTLFF